MHTISLIDNDILCNFYSLLLMKLMFNYDSKIGKRC